jgi:hypothetical protein
VGSRLGTHTFWTVALSATICLLALSPVVLRYETPIERLPGPLAGVVQVGRVVTSSLSSPERDEPADAAPVAAPAPEPDPAPVAGEVDGTESGGGVLAGQAGETGTSSGSQTPPPRDENKPKHALGGPRDNDDRGTPAPVDDEDEDDEDDEDEDDENEERAENDDEERAEKAEHKAEKNKDKAENKAGKKSKKTDEKEKDEEDDDEDEDGDGDGDD